jgi:hypothetical protein
MQQPLDGHFGGEEPWLEERSQRDKAHLGLERA